MTRTITYKSRKRYVNEDAIDWIHGGLDILGLIPGFGEAADLANAVLYAKEGDWLNVALSTISMIPEIGDIFGKGGRIAIYLEKMIVKGGRAGKLAEKIITNAPKVVEFVNKAMKLYKDNKVIINQFFDKIKDVKNDKVQEHIVPNIGKLQNALKGVEKAFDTVSKTKQKTKSSPENKPESKSINAMDKLVATMADEKGKTAQQDFTRSEVQNIVSDISHERLVECKIRAIVHNEIRNAQKSFHHKVLI